MSIETNTTTEDESSRGVSWGWTSAKLIAAALLCWNAQSMIYSANETNPSPVVSSLQHRRLTEVDTTHMPAAAQSSPLAPFLAPLYQDLHEREQLFANTPPEEVKYWFEYAGPLQVR